MGLLDALIYGVRDLFDQDGKQLPRRSRVKFTGDVEDDPINDQIVVHTGTGGGGGSPDAPNKSLQVNNAGAFKGLEGFTREGEGHLNVNRAAMTGGPELVFSASAKTITRLSGSFAADGFATGQLTIKNIASPYQTANNGTKTITSISTTTSPNDTLHISESVTNDDIASSDVQAMAVSLEQGGYQTVGLPSESVPNQGERRITQMPSGSPDRVIDAHLDNTGFSYPLLAVSRFGDVQRGSTLTQENSNDGTGQRPPSDSLWADLRLEYIGRRQRRIQAGIWQDEIYSKQKVTSSATPDTLTWEDSWSTTAWSLIHVRAKSSLHEAYWLFQNGVLIDSDKPSGTSGWNASVSGTTVTVHDDGSSGSVAWFAVGDRYGNAIGGGKGGAAKMPPGAVNVAYFGAVGDYYPGNPSPTDNLAAFQAALAALKTRTNGTSTNSAGILYADGHYYFSDTLHIHQTVTIQGTGRVEPDNGSSSRSAPGTWLVWPDTKSCVVVHGALNVSGGGLGSSINDLTISSTRTATLPPTAGTGNAITAYTKTHVNRCTIENVGGYGFFLSCGSSPAVFEEQGEGWSVINCNIGGVGLDGIYIEGNDSGVGTSFNNTLAVNGGFGIYDRSIGTNFHCNNVGQDNFGNTDGSSGSYDYKADGLIPASTSSLFLNCYSENPCSNAVKKPAMAMGGGLSQAGNNPHGDALQFYPTGEFYTQPVTFHNQTSTPAIDIELGGDDTGNNLAYLRVSGQGYARLYYSNGTGWWYWLDVNSTFVCWPTTKTQHRQVAPLFPSGIYFGQPQDLTGGYAGASAAIYRHDVFSGVPSSGTWERGDIAWETQPGAGNPAGRVTTVAGTAGTLSITGDTTSGSPDISNISNMSSLARWQYIDITGTGKRQIISDPVHPTSPNTITVNSNCGATLTATAIAFSPPTYDNIELSVVSEGFAKLSSLRGQVQTSSTSATTVASYDMADETCVTFAYEVTMARRSSVTKAGTYRGKATYRRSGSGPTIVGSAVYDTDQETTAGDGVAFNISSNTIQVQVTAADSDGRNWLCRLDVTEVSNA